MVGDFDEVAELLRYGSKWDYGDTATSVQVVRLMAVADSWFKLVSAGTDVAGNVSQLVWNERP